MIKMRSDGSLPGSTIRLFALAVIGFAFAVLANRIAVHSVNDTPSYLNYPFGSLEQALLSIRTPGYPIFLAVVQKTFGLSWVPGLQILLHVVAAWAIGEELRHREMSSARAFAASFCVLVGCTAYDHIHTISTDAPAASLGVMTSAFLMRACRSGTRIDAFICGFVAVIAILVRPAYLFLIPWIAVAGWMLLARHAAKESGGAAHATSRLLGVKISVAVALVVIGWMGFRKAVVSDFGIAPFGHQNLSAVLVQTVPPTTLRGLPDKAGELGRLVADALEEEGFELPGQEGSDLPTLTIESQWGNINYGVIWPIARDRFDSEAGSDDAAKPVLVHRRIGAMNLAILKASPQSYGRWLLLAIRRAAWGIAANIVMHPVFLLMILVALVTWFWKAVRGASFGPIEITESWIAFAMSGLSYAVLKVGFIALTSPPIGRFADAAAIFLPALVATLLLPRAGLSSSNQ